MTQYDPNDSTKRQLIWCHSTSLSDAQSRYYAIEGEGLGLVWALQQCDYWLKGCPHFTVVTDHNPLCSLFNHKEYNALSPTMFNYVMHASGYNFTVVHLSGVKNCLADYLSRHPLWSEEGALIQDPNGLVSTRTNTHFINFLVDTQVEKLRTDVLMDPIFEAAKLDQVYKEAVSAKV